MFRKELIINSKYKRQVIDITGLLGKLVLESGVVTGVCQVNVLHTTCALATADLDPGTDLDMLDAWEKMVPKLNYRHPHDPGHVGDHIMSSMIGSSVCLPVEGRDLVLGIWQKVVLLEFSGPQKRNLLVSLFS